MKMVQSFWTKPFLQSEDYLIDSRMDGGWLHRKYNYFSWALSCLQLRKYYQDVELVTDALGKRILIDLLGLPYTHVVVALDALNHYESALWALGKIYAYRIQETPFLHVDSDVFIWRQFDERITGARLAAQNREKVTNNYRSTLVEIDQKFHFLPGYVKKLVGSDQVSCVNAGILGGTDIDFFQKYTGDIFSFIDKNAGSIAECTKVMNVTYLNVIYEQLFFYALSEVDFRKITYLFPDAPDIPKGIGKFHAADANAGFVHCLSVEKKNRISYLMLENRLRLLYPEYYTRITDLIQKLEI